MPDTSTNDSPNLAHSQLIFILTRTGKRGDVLYTYFSTSVPYILNTYCICYQVLTFSFILADKSLVLLYIGHLYDLLPIIFHVIERNGLKQSPNL